MQKTKGLTAKLLCFGTYAVICHLCGILLLYNTELCLLPAELSVMRCTQMLEYSAMSLTVLLIGGLLLYTVGRQESKSSE